jgi:hypothetical protein
MVRLQEKTCLKQLFKMKVRRWTKKREKHRKTFTIKKKNSHPQKNKLQNIPKTVNLPFSGKHNNVASIIIIINPIKCLFWFFSM